jgi:hypothetical protein
MSKQTATEWLYEQLTSTWFDKTSGQDILEQAKEMGKEQMIKFANDFLFHDNTDLTAEQYYNETYGGKEVKKRN